MDNPEISPISKGMSFDSDIVIVGGGLNGPALALALAQTGRSVTILDAQSRPALEDAKFDGRGYALALASQRLLNAIGVWQAVTDQSQPMLDIKVSDGRAGEGPSPFFLHFDHREIEEGPMGYMVEDRYLRRALLEAMDGEPLIDQRFETKVTAQTIDTQSVTLTLDDGGTVTARLLVGADGEDFVERMVWNSLPLGIDADSIYEAREVKLKEGGFLFLHSDALSEMPNAAGLVLEEEGVTELVQRCFTNVEYEQPLQSLIRLFRGETPEPLGDDLTLVSVRLN